MKKVLSFTFVQLVRLDCWVNGLAGGNPHETISCRVGRASARGCPPAIVLDCVLDALFFWEKDHCGCSLRRCEEEQSVVGRRPKRL